MKKLLWITFAFLGAHERLQAQTPVNSSTGYDAKQRDLEQKKLEKGVNYDVNIDVTNREAYYAAGEDSLYQAIYRGLDISKEAYDAQLNTTATLSFQVNFDGKVQDVRLLNSVGFGLDAQLIQAVQRLTFVPARQENIPFRSEVILELPIKARYLYEIQKAAGQK